MWLVENKIFPQVKIFFLLKTGHMKNAADRMFNLLKLSYHNKNIYTYDEMQSGSEYESIHRRPQDEPRRLPQA